METLNNLYRMPDHLEFGNIINNYQGSLEFDANYFFIKDVIDDDNCWYRALSLQLYSTEENHPLVRKDIYEYLNLNNMQFIHLNFEVNGHFINAKDYIKLIKENKFWMGDLELSVIATLYYAIFYVFELREENRLILLSKYGDINDTNKIFLNICFVNNNNYNAIYEKNRLTGEVNKSQSIKIKNLNDIIHKNKIKKEDLQLNFIYANDNRVIKYNDVINYLTKKNYKGKSKYPDYI